MAILNLYVNDGFVPMVDGTLVYHRGFGERPTAASDPRPSLTVSPRVFTADGRVVTSRTYPLGAPTPFHGRPTPHSPDPEHRGQYFVRRRHWASYFPDRTLIAESGSTIRLRVHNRLNQPHELAILGAGRGGAPLRTGRILPNSWRDLVVRAPAPGAYVYCDPGADPVRDPVQRVLGLHGVLLVVDRRDPWRFGPTGPEFERQWLWICHSIDPVWAQLASRGRTVDPQRVPAHPRYFTVNGRSGIQSLAVTKEEEINHGCEEETVASGAPRQVDVRNFSQQASSETVRTGQLLHFVNTGVVSHQMHFHGNHLWTVARNGRMFPRKAGFVDPEGHVVIQQWEDVVELDALDRKESVLPLKRPPDAVDEVWNARHEDWIYPMHCHAEPSQSAGGGLYPGGLVTHWTLAAPDGDPAEHPTFLSQVDFSSKQIAVGSPPNEFLKPASQAVTLSFFNDQMRFPDGSRHEVWSFETETSGRGFPAPLLRLQEGEVFHADLRAKKGPHTIHWHGMEPDPGNDGVGHTSFEITGNYTYQLHPEKGVPGDPNWGAAGSYFYHCHVNTPLHVQMGMFGALVIDPVVHPRFPVTPGVTRRPFVDGPEYDIDTETILVAYSLDPRWHALSHAAGLSGEDVGMDRFDPEHFYLIGGEMDRRPAGGSVWSLSQVRANVRGGTRKPTLLRLLNANYYPARMRFFDARRRPVKMAELVAHDGRPYRDTSRPASPSLATYASTATQLRTNILAFGAAERFDVLLHPPAPGKYILQVDLEHWITHRVLFRKEIPVFAERR